LRLLRPATSLDLQSLQSQFPLLELDTIFQQDSNFEKNLLTLSLPPNRFMDIFVNFDDDELPPLIDPESENSNAILVYAGRVLAMPSECTTNPLQRALADSIIRMVSLDELRILFACGAKVSQRALNYDDAGKVRIEIY
jgi:hypothetical protein